MLVGSIGGEARIGKPKARPELNRDLAFPHKLEAIPIGPTGQDRTAQGKARNERRPGFQPSVAQALKGRDQRMSRTYSAVAKGLPFPRPAVA